jgi:hypothetical protein
VCYQTAELNNSDGDGQVDYFSALSAVQAMNPDYLKNSTQKPQEYSIT